MGLFDKLKDPVFYKESSDAKMQLEELKEFLINAPDELKDTVEQDIKMLSYGISGENNVAFELMNSSMPILILHDLHFEFEGLTAQIDYLVITKKVLIVIECKNLVGNIEVNNNGDFIRTMEYGRKKKREGIYSPITQNQRHLDMLRKIRRSDKSNIISKVIFDKSFENNYKSVVVLANPKTVINMKFAKKDIKEQIIRCDQLIEFIKKLNKESKNDTTSEKQMYELAETFLSHHTPNTIDYKKKYRIQEIEKGTSVQNDSKGEEMPFIQSNVGTEIITTGQSNVGTEIITTGLRNVGAEIVTTVQSNEVEVNITSVHNNDIEENIIENNTAAKETAPVQNLNLIEVADIEQNNSSSNNLQDTPIYQELKLFRNIRSKQEKIKPYFIYNNSQMEEIIHLMPRSIVEIKSISGFGDLKCKKYGEEILNIINRNR